MIKKLSTLCSILLATCIPSVAQVDTTVLRAQNDTITAYLREMNGPSLGYIGRVRVDSIRVDGDKATIYYAPTMAQYALRTESCDHVYSILKSAAPSVQISARSEGKEIHELVPKFYKEDGKRKKTPKSTSSLVEPLNRLYNPIEGLKGRHIAMWQSHGYYYEQKLLRWEWQRARIFQTVEDLYTQSFVLPYIVPMVERAGAVVLLPRERDIQTVEIIADNDAMSGYYEKNGKYAWSKGEGTGFAHVKEYYVEGENPFTMGTYRQAPTTTTKGTPSVATWQPSFSKEGQYAVYVSYKTLPNSAPDAKYTVYHKGGVSSYKVNQTMGGGTWIYLGTFDFDKGTSARIELSNVSAKEGRVVTADALKIGGGMGNIARTPTNDTSKVSGDARRAMNDGYTPEPIISGYPRFTEAARYFMQWAGFPTSVYSRYDGQDYTDDYGGRGPWVNYLAGGTSVNPDGEGLNIPVDLSFAFHSDAGTRYGDQIVGTLMIYTLKNEGNTDFLNGSSRYVNRDLADIIQTEISDDIRAQACPEWTRRQLMNGNYSESRIPQVPSTLLELLSHQNFSDMRLGLDPRFRFIVSRAVYKGMVKFLAAKDNRPYTIQPLPVAQMRTEFTAQDRVKLSWAPVIDTLEATATPDAYIVYTRIGDGAFDTGVKVTEPQFETQITPGQIYSWKVTAVNKGGESMDSEILSAYRAVNEKDVVMIVNGFDRVSAPSSFASPDSTFAGFQDNKDRGVPYISDISYIGSQHEFRRNIPWMDDDSAGFGASDGDYETMVIAGNTFDYPVLHGRSFAALGYSFVSSSRAAVESGAVKLSDYHHVDLILGKQRQSVLGHNRDRIDFEAFTPALREAIKSLTAAGGNILVSGAYVGTDIWDSEKGFKKDKEAMSFANNVLKYRWMTDGAARTGRVSATTTPLGYVGGTYEFVTTPNKEVYCVESPDGIEPFGKKAYCIMRYKENNIGAATAYDGDDYKTVIIGFPIEVVCGSQERTELIGKVMDFFTEKE